MRTVAVSLLLLAVSGFLNIMCRSYTITVPSYYQALSGDLDVLIRLEGPTSSSVTVELLEVQPCDSKNNRTSRLKNSTNATRKWEILGSMSLETNSTEAKVTFPCGVIAKGGLFGVRLVGIRGKIARKSKWRDILPPRTYLENSTDIVGLDVRWPSVALSVAPRTIETYPKKNVTAYVQFLPGVCVPPLGTMDTETWLDLVFCGPSSAGCSNSTHRQVVYSEQIRGFPRKRDVVLRCDLFGVAGYYALSLRPSLLSSSAILTQNEDSFIKVVWSNEYIFNVGARSIFPCDVHGDGVSVLFQYPTCSIKGDRIRLYSHLRADVSAVSPPKSLNYVTEKSVQEGEYVQHFDCDLFSEKFVEYCFVYVAKAITGAVSDVRMDCVPTLAVSESDYGGWGPWSPWTSCTTTCGTGTRNRFRLCDSPPPRYGAKFCEGPAVETQSCGNTDWACEFSSFADVSKNEEHLLLTSRADIQAEIGPGCRCGCIVHLGAVKPKRMLAASSQSCPGRAFWLIQADEDHIIELIMQQYRLPCRSQWIKIRDGDSSSSTLIGELSNGAATVRNTWTSSNKHMLLEFFSDELLTGGQECWGGFLAHATQRSHRTNNSNWTNFTATDFALGSLLRNVQIMPVISDHPSLVHFAAVVFLVVVFFMTACIGVQYLHKYRKYQRAAAAEDMDSLTANSQSSLMPIRTSRATSNSTLFSEVISLRRFRTRTCQHSRLNEVDIEAEIDEEEGNKSPTGSQLTLKADSGDDRDKSSQSTLTEDAVATGSEKSPAIGLYNNTSSLSSNSSKETFQSSYRETSNSDYSSVSSAKARKDRRNLEKMLAGSDFSLPGEADLEMDYYDYNVMNASAVPESYIGMDPAYLVWIPPTAHDAVWETEEKIEEEESKEEQLSNLDKITGDTKPRKTADRGHNETEKEEGEKETAVEKCHKNDEDCDIKFADDVDNDEHYIVTT